MFTIESEVWERVKKPGQDLWPSPANGGPSGGNNPPPRCGTSPWPGSRDGDDGKGGGNGGRALYADYGWMYGGRGQSECAVGDYREGTPPMEQEALTGLWHWAESKR